MKDWIFLFLGLFLAVIYDIVKPWASSYLKKSSLSFRERRIDVLLTRYDYIRFLRRNPELGNFTILRLLTIGWLGILTILGWIGLPLVVVTLGHATFERTSLFYIVWLIGILTLFIVCFLAFNKALKDIEDVQKFNKYKEKVIAKLKKLDVNEEDLEETVG